MVSGGTASLVSVPTTIGGVAVAVEGAFMMKNAANNIVKAADDSKQSGKSDRKIVVDDANKIDRDLLNPPEKSGKAPKFKKDGSSVEIHHENQNPNGPFKEMHRDDHRGPGNHSKNHPEKESKIDRKDFDKQRKEYWRNEYPH